MEVWANGMWGNEAWMSDYEQYESSIWNRINSMGSISANAPNGINKIKTWLSNHNNPSNTTGGLGVFGKNMDNYQTALVQSGPYYQQEYLSSWGTSEQHIMTIVGYHDGVNCGSQGVGAFLVANSWGTTDFGNEGYIWLPYSLAAAGLILNVIDTVEYRQPQVVAKIKLKHNCRNKIRLGILISDDYNASTPYDISAYSKVFYAMNSNTHSNNSNGGGELSLNGLTNDPIEIAYDISDFIEENYPNQPVPKLKFILGIEEDDPDGLHEGEILDFSILDYREDPNNPFEVYDHVSGSVPILNNDETEMELYYFVLPETISTNQVPYYHPTIVRGQVLIPANETLTISSEFFDFYDDGHLEVQNGGLLNLNTNTSVLAMRGANNQITLIGDMQLGYNISFGRRNAFPTLPHFSLMLNNISKNYSFGSFEFTGSILGESNALALHDVTFIDADVDYKYGDFSLSGSDDISLTSLVISEPASASKAISISENDFTYSQSNQAIITIEDYSSYEIVNNTINHGYGDGIHLNNAGDIEGDKKVSYNIISNNGSSSSASAAGIVVYNSHTDIHFNTEITGNPYGIKSLNNSKTSIRGNKLAHSPSETQHIYDNNYNQIFSMPDAVPYYCHWNAIENSATSHLELFYYENPPNCIGITDVRWNYWGPSFDPATDLVQGCIYEPVWNNFTSITDTLLDADEQLYNTATLQINAGNYSGAQQSLKQLIINYPDSLLAEVAIKDLYVMEDQAGNNFDSLILFYENDSVIQSHLPLKRIANYLINFCELKQENFQEAIDGFTSVILNPETFEDSICAIIDLAYAYQEMENSSGRDFYLGSLPQYYYHTKKLYRDSRQYHLSLINTNERQINEYADGSQLTLGQFIKQNYPNPSSQHSNFAFKLIEDAGVEIIIFDQLGRVSLGSGNRIYEKGDHNLKMDVSSLPAGVYFYSLKLDGNIYDTGKMIKVSQ